MVRDGVIKYKEDVVDGLENAPRSVLLLLLLMMMMMIMMMMMMRSVGVVVMKGIRRRGQLCEASVVF
jgi:hypothetical protein